MKGREAESVREKRGIKAQMCRYAIRENLVPVRLCDEVTPTR